MKIELPFLATDLSEIPAEARALEQLGCDGAFTFEGPHDPFLPLTLAAGCTERLDLTTAVAIAFPRSPMHVAQTAHDLQVFSRGRFRLGLGSQVRAHIEKRFSATWTKPVARMREFVQALRAIWRCWNDNERLDFRGEFYRHTLMAPYFSPGPSPFGPPRVLLGGVGRPMTTAAGEVADGLIVHPFHSPDFLRGTTLPAIEAGLARAGRARGEFEIVCQALVITGYSEDEMRQAEMSTRMQIAFYGSTPAYRGVFETHGWGELQEELRALSLQGRWMEMGERIDDTMLDAFAVRCAPSEVPQRLQQRYAGLVDRLALICHSTPQKNHAAEWAEVLARLRSQ